ncbi:MAG: hypothetical protein KatS3mg002_1132 [Candidatus Woesearchaeota archaeon]|nr:MAG: hypothetical protein KatS3mg002_1132 [Candidatus Woesearchaeota archaeon]
MGIFNLFKKKEPEMDIDSTLGLNTQHPFEMPESNLMNNPSKSFDNQGYGGFGQTFQEQPILNQTSNSMSQSFQNPGDLQKDIQILSLKLDAIKAELDSINQRIKNIESIAEKEQSQQMKKWY